MRAVPTTIQVPIICRNSQGLPKYETLGAAGMDLRSTMDVELGSLERMAVPTGIFLEIPEGYEGQVRPRSGLAAKFGVGMVNAPGTIDSDYRGEIKVLLVNLSPEPVKLLAGERIAQIVFAPVVRAELVQTSELAVTVRGEGGFGSTGTH